MDIQTILRVYNLHDLASSVPDIENDVALLLQWLNPALSPPAPLLQPSPRVKAAIRRCLKDLESQLDFVSLYCNSLRSTIPATLQLALSSGDFGATMAAVATNVTFFKLCTQMLGLEPAASRTFYRSLRAIFRAGLLKDSQFSVMLAEYLEKNLVIPLATLPEAHTQIQLLAQIGMSDEVAALVTSLAISRIRHYVRSTCTAVWDQPVLRDLNRWVESQLDCFHTIDPSFMPLLHLVQMAHTELVLTRISELFDLVAAYPRSFAALQELHECVLLPAASASENLSHRVKLVDAFIEQCRSRLLHSGANTVEVVTIYTATIRSFLVIDPKGVLLDKVVRPIRRYLKLREDTINTLVHGLLDESPDNPLSDLTQELRLVLQAPVHMGDEDMSVWMPDPIDALPDFKKGKVTDVIESLISIFDLKDVFVAEFTRIFGARLLSLHDYGTLPIEQQLDFLKKKFGEEEFSMLDVMIRDVKNSRRANRTISTSPFHSSILSHMYWTDLPDNEMELFELAALQGLFEEYNDNYKKKNGGRYLQLRPTSGQVTLNIDTQGATRTFTVSPGEAAVILEFDENTNVQSVADICQKLRMQQYSAQNSLMAWVNRGILTEKAPGVFCAND